MSKVIVAYMDNKKRVRILVNPSHIEKYLNKSNCVINPPLEELLAKGHGPSRWHIKDGKLHIKLTPEKTQVSSLDVYDLFCDIEDKKQDMEKWFTVQVDRYNKLNGDFIMFDQRLRRIDAYLLRWRKMYSRLVFASYVLFTMVIIWQMIR